MITLASILILSLSAEPVANGEPVCASVRAINEDLTPIADLPLVFMLEGQACGQHLLEAEAKTDADGIAKALIMPGGCQDPGTILLVMSADSSDYLVFRTLASPEGVKLGVGFLGVLLTCGLAVGWRRIR